MTAVLSILVAGLCLAVPAGRASRRPPLTLTEAAAYLNVTARHVRRLVFERQVTYTKVGRLLRFDPDDLDEYLAERTVARRGSSPSYSSHSSGTKKGLPPASNTGGRHGPAD